MTAFSCRFHPGPFTFWDLCTCRRMRATIFTIERPLLSSWLMPISVWSLGRPIPRDSWNRDWFFLGVVLRGWNRPETFCMIGVWKEKQGRNLRKKVSTLHCWNLLFFCLGVARKLQNSSIFLGWLDIATFSCCLKFNPLKLRDWHRIVVHRGHHYIFLHGIVWAWSIDFRLSEGNVISTMT